MDRKTMYKIKNQIYDGRITALESFKLGIDLQKSSNTDEIWQIYEAFDVRQQEIDGIRSKITSALDVEKEALVFLKNSFRIFNSRFEIDIGEYCNNETLLEGISSFSKELGIRSFTSHNETKYEIEIYINIEVPSILYKIFGGIVTNLCIKVSNDSCADSFVAESNQFEAINIEQLINGSKEQINQIKYILKSINSIGIDDYDTFLSICLSLGELDKDWLDKSLFLSQLANDGGKTLAKMINDKYLDEGIR